MKSFSKNHIQISIPTVLFFICCLLLFSASLFLPVFENGVDGWGAFIFWPIPLFSGDFTKFRIACAWFANPIWLFASLLHLFSFHRASLNSAIIGFLVATLFLTFDRLSFGPVGPFYHRDLGSGFYIWYLLFISLIVFEFIFVHNGRGRKIRKLFGE